MANLLPKYQEVFSINVPGTRVIYTLVTLLSTSDTVILPILANTSSGAAVKQLLRGGDTAATVTSGTAAVGPGGETCVVATIAGVAGNEVVLVSLHEYHSDFIHSDTNAVIG